MMKIRIATVHHSGFGHTTRLAEAVKEGVEQVAGAAALLLTVEEAQTRWTDLSSAEAIIFGAPTYTAGASAEFKAFEEARTRAVMAKGLGWKDNVATGFTNSGSRSGDKLATLIQLALFAAQHGMLWINLGLPPANHSTKGSEAELNRLGFWLGAGAQSNVIRARPRATRVGSCHRTLPRASRRRGNASIRPRSRSIPEQCRLKSIRRQSSGRRRIRRRRPSMSLAIHRGHPLRHLLGRDILAVGCDRPGVSEPV